MVLGTTNFGSGVVTTADTYHQASDEQRLREQDPERHTYRGQGRNYPLGNAPGEIQPGYDWPPEAVSS